MATSPADFPQPVIDNEPVAPTLNTVPAQTRAHEEHLLVCRGRGHFDRLRVWSLRNTNTLQMSSLLSRVITDLDATAITTTNCCATNSNHATATGN